MYFSEESDRRKLFNDYVLMGGLAGSYEYASSRDRIAYLKDVYRTIVNRNLVDKYRLTDTAVKEPWTMAEPK
jgi:predicted AAA+ superfamily ATPase